jgi:hypothetical protein
LESAKGCLEEFVLSKAPQGFGKSCLDATGVTYGGGVGVLQPSEEQGGNEDDAQEYPSQGLEW